MNSSPYGWWLPLDASTHGAEIDHLINIIHVFMAVLFVGWGIYFVYCLFRFRQKPGHQASSIREHFKFPKYLETGVLIVEIWLLVFVSSPLWFKVKTAFPAEKDALVVRVVAEQFAWNIHYPGKDGKFGKTSAELVDGVNTLGLDREDPDAKDDIVTINIFHVPVNKPVIVHLSSKDVIHSFSLPVLRVKQDTIPGMTIPIWFEAKRAGQPGEEFDIACAQLCGLGHYRMKGMLYLDTPEQFAAWMAEEEKNLAAESGESS